MTESPVPPPDDWAARALRDLAADAAPTPLRPVRLPALPEIDLYVKDESAHPTGSVKHRLLRELYRAAVQDGTLTEGTPVVMGSGGAAAVAGAYFARLLGLPFTAVLPRTAPAAVHDRIAAHGGRCRTGELPPVAVLEEARTLARRTGATSSTISPRPGGRRTVRPRCRTSAPRSSTGCGAPATPSRGGW